MEVLVVMVTVRSLIDLLASSTPKSPLVSSVTDPRVVVEVVDASEIVILDRIVPVLRLSIPREVTERLTGELIRLSTVHRFFIPNHVIPG